MDDVARLELAAARLRKLGFHKNATNNFADIVKLAKDVTNMHLTENHALREKLWSTLMAEILPSYDGKWDQFKERVDAFELLLGPHTNIVDITGLMSFCPEDLKEKQLVKVMRLIAENAPNVKQLKLKEMSLSIGLFDFISSEILKLKNLQKLEIINCPIEYLKFMDICSNLQHLEYADVPLIFEGPLPEDVEAFKKCFSRLKVFLFHTAPHETKDQLRRMCLQHLPNLQVAGVFAESTMEDYFEENKRISQLPPVVSNLRHLDTYPSTLGLHMAFPNVTHLKVKFRVESTESEISEMLKFNQIESLVLVYVPSAQILERFLAKYGHNLHFLRVNGLPEAGIPLEFKTVFNYCPKLQSLCLFDVKVTDDWKAINFFADLRYFYWEPTRSTSAVLSNILLAPNLQTFGMGNQSFQIEDLKKVSRLIAENRILHHLRTLRFDQCEEEPIYFEYEIEKQDSHFVNFFRAFADLVKNVIAFLPNLTSVHLRFDIESHDWDEVRKKYGDEAMYEPDDRYLAAFTCLGEPNLAKFLNMCS